MITASETQRKLTQAEILNLFVSTLADVYTSKSSLMTQLPIMAGKVTSTELKLMILNLGTIVNGQRIRLRLAVSLLQKGGESKEIVGNLDLDKFLHGHLGSIGFETDAIILTHLIVAETIEIASFNILAKLALNIYPKTVGALINVSLKEAMNSKKSLEDFLARNYLSSNAG